MSKEKTVEEKAEELAKLLEQRVSDEERAALEALLSEDSDNELESDSIDEASRRKEVQRILDQDSDQEVADKIKESQELVRRELEDKGGAVAVQKTEEERLAEAKNQSENIASSLAQIKNPEFKKIVSQDVAGRVRVRDYGFRLSEAEIIFDKLNRDDKKEIFAELKPENQKEVMFAMAQRSWSDPSVRVANGDVKRGQNGPGHAEIVDEKLFRELWDSAKQEVKESLLRVDTQSVVYDALDAKRKAGFIDDFRPKDAVFHLPPEEQMEVFRALKTQEARQQLMDEFMSANVGWTLDNKQKIELFRHVIKEQSKPETSALITPRQLLERARGQQNNRRQEEPFKISDQTRELYVAALMQEVVEDEKLKTSLDDLYEARDGKTLIQDGAKKHVTDVIVSKLKEKDVSGGFSNMNEGQEEALKKEIGKSLEKATRKTVWQRVSSSVQNFAVSVGLMKKRPALSAEESKKAALGKQSKAIIKTARKTAKKRLSKQGSKAKRLVKGRKKEVLSR